MICSYIQKLLYLFVTNMALNKCKTYLTLARPMVAIQTVAAHLRACLTLDVVENQTQG
jgi:hypothetical protein